MFRPSVQVIFAHTDKRHGFGTKFSPLGRLDESFGFHKRVEYAHERGALPGEILQVEKLESAEAASSQCGLDIFAVAEHGQRARCTEKVVGLVEHTVLFEAVAEDLEIACPHNAGIFVDFAVVGIYLVLRRFRWR